MSDAPLEYDTAIVGAGPAGLAAAIKLKQLNSQHNVCIVEKGANIGSHILSGAVLEPGALTELLPNWPDLNAPVTVKVCEERFYFLREQSAIKIPQWILPAEMKNHGNYVISLGRLCRFLGEQAEQLGVDVFPSTAAQSLLFDNNRVIGIKTGELGLAQDHQKKSTYTPSFAIQAKHTLLAEGCRGYLSEQVIKHYHLRSKNCLQTYGLGIKELWQVPKQVHPPGSVLHTAGWPLDANTYGGSFIYHLDDNKIALGFVTALDYQNPYLDPFKELQRFKCHPVIAPMLQNGKRLCYGARTLNEGGYGSLPKLTFPGGALLGCAAGLLDVAKIKGIHNALRSGMQAAHAIVTTNELDQYAQLMQQSTVYKELKKSRNFRHYFRYGLIGGSVLAGLDLKLFQGKLPWTLTNRHHDRNRLKKSQQCSSIQYATANHTTSFDRLESVYLANISSDDNQPNHLEIKQQDIPYRLNYLQYAAPETHYCPAKVYEYTSNDQQPAQLLMHPSNCIHCKACDIKDPGRNIRWHLPEGGSGPNYMEM